MPRFENVDLTPTWDDVDPAALDFGVGATEVDVDALELNPQPLPPQPEPEAEPEPAPVEAAPEAEFAPPAHDETTFDEGGDDSAFWESGDQFDSGAIGPDDLPDGFDDLG